MRALIPCHVKRNGSNDLARPNVSSAELDSGPISAGTAAYRKFSLALVIAGVIVGGVAAWMRQGKWRWRARLAESKAHDLRVENDQLKRRDGAVPSGAPPSVDHAPRLRIPPPAA